MGRADLKVLLVNGQGGASAREVSEALRGDGHSVTVAQDVRAAMLLADRHDPDIVILWSCVPDVATLTCELREQHVRPDTVILALSEDPIAGDWGDHEAALDLNLRLPIETELLSGLLHYLRSLRMTAAVEQESRIR